VRPLRPAVHSAFGRAWSPSSPAYTLLPPVRLQSCQPCQGLQPFDNPLSYTQLRPPPRQVWPAPSSESWPSVPRSRRAETEALTAAKQPLMRPRSRVTRQRLQRLMQTLLLPSASHQAHQTILRTPRPLPDSLRGPVPNSSLTSTNLARAMELD
jgi:hypothetical protein